jgi:hypothetical protein
MKINKSKLCTTSAKTVFVFLTKILCKVILLVFLAFGAIGSVLRISYLNTCTFDLSVSTILFYYTMGHAA